MPKYAVTFTFEVESESEEQAETKAFRAISIGLENMDASHVSTELIGTKASE